MIGLNRRLLRAAIILVCLRITLYLVQSPKPQRIWKSTLPKLDYDEVPPSESIFFVETNDEVSEIRGRTLCALESAARLNPDKQVFFLATHMSNIATVPNYISQYRNVHIRSFDISELAADTELQELWESGQVQASEHFLSHCSDLLRFLLLTRFGGMYMDQDVLSVKPLPKDIPNFLVSEGNNHFLTSAVLRLEQNHPILDIVRSRLVKL